MAVLKSNSAFAVMAIIYMATCVPSGKRYIGQTRQSLRMRSFGHRSSAKSGSMNAMACAIRKYGFEAFTWTELETCSLEELDEREIALIEQHNTLCPNGYNITIGGRSVPEHNKQQRKLAEDAELPKHVYSYSHTTGSGFRVQLPDGRKKAFMNSHYSQSEKLEMAKQWCAEALADPQKRGRKILRKKREDNDLPVGVTRHRKKNAKLDTFTVTSNAPGTKQVADSFDSKDRALACREAMHALVMLSNQPEKSCS